MANHNKEKHHSGPAVSEQAKNAVGATGEAIKDAATSAGKMAGDAASYVGEKADDASKAVGQGMKSVADTVRDSAPKDGILGSAASTVADTLETSGKYLHEHGLGGIAEDLMKTVRQHPLPAILVGMGVGLLLGRFTRS